MINKFIHIDELTLKFTKIIQDSPDYRYDSILRDAITETLHTGQMLQLGEEIDRNKIRNHTMNKLEQRIKDLEKIIDKDRLIEVIKNYNINTIACNDQREIDSQDFNLCNDCIEGLADLIIEIDN